jgi:hypothetical protein
MSQSKMIEQQRMLQSSKMYDDLNSSNSSSGVSEDEEHDHMDLIVKRNSKMQHNRYMSLPNENHEKFLRTVYDNVLKNAIFEGTKRENKVLEWTSPEEMLRKFDMQLKDEGDSDEVLLQLANDTIKYSVKTGHPYFVNQLFSCVDPYGFAGQVITGA